MRARTRGLPAWVFNTGTAGSETGFDLASSLLRRTLRVLLMCAATSLCHHALPPPARGANPRQLLSIRI
jgi:hypothetical protein